MRLLHRLFDGLVLTTFFSIFFSIFFSTSSLSSASATVADYWQHFLPKIQKGNVDMTREHEVALALVPLILLKLSSTMRPSPLFALLFLQTTCSLTQDVQKIYPSGLLLRWNICHYAYHFANTTSLNFNHTGKVEQSKYQSKFL